MPIAKPLAAFIGVLTVWPLVYAAVVATLVFGASADPALATGTETFALLFRVHLITMLVTFGLMAYFVVHVFNNDHLSPDERLLWLVVLFLGSVFAFPVYWYRHLWRVPRPPPP